MNFMFSAWVDLVSAIGMIVALSFAYARFRRVLRFRRLSELALGASFGVVAILEMHHQIEPMPGLFIDMRNVPIALAGAFLGGPAALVTLAMAVFARATFGGVGMYSGMLAMVFALGAGRLWAYWYSTADSRGVKAMFVLAALTSLHLAGGLILPPETAIWFYTNAAPSILLLNMLTIPLLAAGLEAERLSYENEQSLRASVAVDEDTGLLPVEAMQRECIIRATALSDGSYTHALVVNLRSDGFLSVWNTALMRKRLLAAMRLRLQSVLPQCDLACIIGASSLVLPLTQAELFNIELTKVSVRRAATEDPYETTGFAAHRISIDCEVVDLQAGDDLHACLASPKHQQGPLLPAKTEYHAVPFRNRVEQAQKPGPLSEVKRDHLFAKAVFLMDRNMSS